MKEDNNLIFGMSLGILIGVILGVIIQMDYTDKIIAKKEAENMELLDIVEWQTYELDSIYKIK